ncbi:Rrf2 family transcriptional regulator [bacterium LRH843]|nr:Rrf2 family transcriptional regulator [bacterium LRH843]
MRLTNYTDYSLRVLIYLGIHQQKRLATIQEIADNYNISKNHLMKVAYELGKAEYVESIRGRNGGLRLARDPKDINIGEVVRTMEEDFHIVECFDKTKNACIISPACHLKGILSDALNAYIEVLDRYTLEDLVQNKNQLLQLFNK